MAIPNFFSLKLNSEAQLKKLSIGNEFGSKIVIEGFLGELKQLTDFEETLVRIEFERGEINLDISLQELVKALEKKKMDKT